MEWLRPRRRLGLALGVLLLLPACWAALLAVVPTDRARRLIVGRLSRASGREVTLGRVRVGLLGGVTLHDLAIAAPRSGGDPWLRVVEASINVGPRQLLFGRVEPSAVDVRGLRLRVLRRLDGTLELADLLRSDPDPKDASASVEDREPTALEVRVRDAEVTILDEPTGTRLEFTGVEGRGTSRGGLLIVQELRGVLNGGPFQFAAQVDRTDREVRYEGQVRLREASLRGGIGALAYLIPVAAGAAGDLDGKGAIDLYLRGRGDTREELRRTLVGQGRVVLDPIVLDGSRLLLGLGAVMDLPPRGRVGAVHSDLTIKNGRVATENLTFEVARAPVVLAGWTDFDGRLDYRLRAEGLVGKLPGKARDLLDDLDLDLNELADVKVGGTVDAPAVTVGGVALDSTGAGGPGRRLDDPRRLREIGRRLQERIRR